MVGSVLPTHWEWDSKQKRDHLILENDNLTITYVGPGGNSRDAASIRSNIFIPPECGIFYFEISILNKGTNGFIGIGLSSKETVFGKLPGWDTQSYGYHGDDGHAFESSGIGSPYGPGFTQSDVVGCGIDFISNTIFFTKNGINLGPAFVNVNVASQRHYPTVGLRTKDEKIRANFSGPFVFDLQKYEREQCLQLYGAVSGLTAPKLGSVATLHVDVQRLVRSYLIYHGYQETTKALSKSLGVDITADIEASQHRQSIQKLMLQNDFDAAIRETRLYYPSLLKSNAELHFQLKCRKFIEMVKQFSQTEGKHASAPDLTMMLCLSSTANLNNYATSSQQQSLSSSLPCHYNTSTQSSHNYNQCNNNTSLVTTSYHHHHQRAAVATGYIAADDENDFIDCDDVKQPERKKLIAMLTTTTSPASAAIAIGDVSNSDECIMTSEGNLNLVRMGRTRVDNNKDSNMALVAMSTTVNNSTDDVSMLGDVDAHYHNINSVRCGGNKGANMGAVNATNSRIMALVKVIAYGRKLNRLAKDSPRFSDETRMLLKDAFSLLAYTDPLACPAKYLLDSDTVQSTAHTVNKAMLAYDNLPQQPPLCVALSQLERCCDALLSKSNSALKTYLSPAALYAHFMLNKQHQQQTESASTVITTSTQDFNSNSVVDSSLTSS